MEKARRAADEGCAYALANLTWYGLMAGGAWLIHYVILRKPILGRKIIPRFPSMGQQGREIYHSLVSLLVFGSVAGMVAFASRSGFRTRLYGPIDKFGWGWYLARSVIALLAHDAYFYWTHRLLHHQALFRRMHRIHRKSMNPTPWAAYSFNIGEA